MERKHATPTAEQRAKQDSTRKANARAAAVADSIASIENAKALARIKPKLRAQRDEFEGITWYYTPKAKASNSTRLMVYIGTKENAAPWARIRLVYHARTWLFCRSAEIKAGTLRFDKAFSADDWKRDNSSGGVWEWLDLSLTTDHSFMLQALQKHGGTIRFQGDTYYHDFKVPKWQVDELVLALEAFKAMGGEVPLSTH